MLSAIILSVLGMLYGFYLEYSAYFNSSFYNYLKAGLIGLLFGACVGWIIALTLPVDVEQQSTEIEIVSLYGMKNSKGVFLSSDMIEKQMYYKFYYKEDGMFRVRAVEASHCKIRYTNEQPKVIEYIEVETDYWMNRFAQRVKRAAPTYIIEVPEGSIEEIIDLKIQ